MQYSCLSWTLEKQHYPHFLFPFLFFYFLFWICTIWTVFVLTITSLLNYITQLNLPPTRQKACLSHTFAFQSLSVASQGAFLLCVCDHSHMPASYTILQLHNFRVYCKQDHFWPVTDDGSCQAKVITVEHYLLVFQLFIQINYSVNVLHFLKTQVITFIFPSSFCQTSSFKPKESLIRLRLRCSFS